MSQPRLYLVLCLLISATSFGRAFAQQATGSTVNDPAQEARFMTRIRQLTFEGKRAGEGYYSHDGSLMVFQSERDAKNPWYQIFLLDLETGDTERISPGYGKTTCSWVHPNNRQVLYASTHLDPTSIAQQDAELAFRASGQTRRYSWDYDEHFELFAYDRVTKKQTQLTRARGYDAEGSYSPDGKLICFASNRAAFLEPLSAKDQQRFDTDQSLFMDLYMMNADGSNVRRLTFARGYDGGPFFNHDGTKICWRRFAENGLTAEIYTANIDGSDKKCLTGIKAMSWAPYFHPSGEYLIFTTNRHGFSNFELYLVDPEGRGEPVRASFTDGFDGLPTFTPDGLTIAWTTTRTKDKTSQIHTAKWNHAEASRLIAASVKAGRKEKAAAPRPKPHAPRKGKNVAAIDTEDLKRHVFRLASEEMGGRMTGSAGGKLATEYVADKFRELGLLPAGNAGSFFQPFPVTIKGQDGQADRKLQGRNVLARLMPSDPAAAQQTAVIIGAHVDHLGTTGAKWSRAKGESKSELHLGADDNASGVAAILEIAEWMTDLKRRGKLKLNRPVVFAAWSGEELGVLGSTHFCRNLSKTKPLNTYFACYINLDMVGRLEKSLILSGVGSSSVWSGAVERRNIPVGLPISLVADCNLPTDTQPFYLGGVPILSAFTGAHLDYHRPTDTPDKLNYEGMRDIAKLLGLLTRGMAMRAEAPDYLEHKDEGTRKPRGNLQPYLGSIPDYAEADIPGLALSGVATGGPAHKAGVRGGDIITGLAGVEVIDIHTYMTAIEKLRIGKTVKITVVRAGEDLTFDITPGSRE
ncbi:MAG: M28 family peptidase [Planctomycetota bacterium]